MKSMAKTISLIARQASNQRRIGKRTHAGAMFSALSKPQGMAQRTARIVPQTAICTVMIVSSR